MMQNLCLDKIRIDGGTQPRESIDYDLVDDYSEIIDCLPPITVFNDGAEYWLADGFHRYHAHKKAEIETINCDVKTGSLRDAILYSVGANSSHGKRRTNADKRKAVLTMLNDKEWASWSDSEIARRCCVHHTTVGDLRSSLGITTTERMYTDRHGNVSKMNTDKIGKNQPAATSYTKPEEDDEFDDLDEVVADVLGDIKEVDNMQLAKEAIAIIKKIDFLCDYGFEAIDAINKCIDIILTDKEEEGI